MGPIDNHYGEDMHKDVLPPFLFFVPYLVKYWYKKN